MEPWARVVRALLRTVLLRTLQPLAHIFGSALAMAGLFFTRLNPLRVAVSVTVALFTALLLGYEVTPALGDAAIFCALAFAARYVFLFLSFPRAGIAERLKARFGRELGFSVYEAATVLLSFAQRVGFFWLVVASGETAAGSIGMALMSSGALLAAFGVCISVWATASLGVDTYYYRDLFMGQRHASFKAEGPYTLVHNPQYGLGQLTAYGVALAAASPLGLLVAALEQALLYAFNALVEQPHLRAASRLSIDAELRDTLARTVTELDVSYKAVGGSDWARYATAKGLRPPPKR
jgi:protein-S-isoprenylcysteine O-methyltransferase Ste14